ncbi:MAG: exodeoxyribonuclease VII small subunit [Rickettsiales bacterium]|nr:exodeoxyribonuclease VII small subunit [Rickettsiales bacterium]
MTENNKELSFEKAIIELENITRKLESGNLELEESIKLYEKGTELVKICEKRLSDAKLKVDQIVKDEAGNKKLEPFPNEFEG